MDEPFAGLDEETKKTVIELILSKRGGRTLLMASHDAEDALLLNAEKLVLAQGRVSKV
jgi:NitT/TauT family transport system ATP-binding protein